MEQANLNQEDLKVVYFRVTDLWQMLCEKHSLLLEQTEQEYSLLLESDLDKLEEVTAKKELTITSISLIEEERKKIIKLLHNSNLGPVENLSDLTNLLEPMEKIEDQYLLQRFNKLLIRIIESTQKQNKTNQKFLTQAITSLQSVRNQALGVKNVTTYNSKGKTKQFTISERL